MDSVVDGQPGTRPRTAPLSEVPGSDGGKSRGDGEEGGLARQRHALGGARDVDFGDEAEAEFAGAVGARVAAQLAAVDRFCEPPAVERQSAGDRVHGEVVVGAVGSRCAQTALDRGEAAHDEVEDGAGEEEGEDEQGLE